MSNFHLLHLPGKALLNSIRSVIFFFLLFCILLHLWLFSFFLYCGLCAPILISLGGLLFHGLLLALSKRFLWGVVVSAQVEICLFVLLMTLLTGWRSGIYLYAVAMLSGIFFVGSPTSPKFFVLQGMDLLTLILLLLLSPLTATHLNGLDLALDGLYTPLFSCNLLFSSFNITVTAVLYFRPLQHKTQQLEDTNRKLEYLATHDTLTGLQNRRSIASLLQLCRAQADRGSIPFSVAMGDIDNFKAFNDTYGHAYGDQILTTLAETIQRITREGDYVCRWGGEEILILFSATHQSAAKSVLVRVQERLRQLGESENSPLSASVTMTFGLSEYAPGMTVDQLICNADEKLYRGKAGGKNCIVE